MTVVTTQDLVDEVRKIANESPDFVYESTPNGGCSYFGRAIGDPTGQCCIVGQAFKNLGVDTSGIDEDIRLFSPSVRDLITKEIVPVKGLDDSYLLWWLGEVQDSQDIGVPWGEAIGLVDGRV